MVLLSFSCIDEGHQTERDSPYQFRSTSYVLMYHLVGEALMFGTFCNTTQMFQLPSVIANTITATRIYRSLADYTFESTNVDAGFSKSGTKVSKIKSNNPAPIPHNRIEVAVDTAYEQNPSSRTAHSVGTQQGDKPHKSSVSRDMECTTETGSAK